MVCRSGKVSRTADKTVNAMKQIEKLENALKAKADDFKKDFYARITDALEAAEIHDAVQRSFGVETKVEYSSEFSIDAITNVVTNAIKAYGVTANSAGDKEGKSLSDAATSKEAIDSYVNLVNSIGEAAKSSSKSDGSFSFQMTRMGPGMFLFLSAKSSSLQDKDTFGSEAVTATSFIYRIMRSEADIESTTNFDLKLIKAAVFKQNAEIDAENIVRFKHLESGLIDRLSSGDITIEIWKSLNTQYEAAIADIQKTLDNEHFATPTQPKHNRLLQGHVGSSNHNFKPIGGFHKHLQFQSDYALLTKLNEYHSQLHQQSIEHGATPKQEKDHALLIHHIKEATQVIKERVHNKNLLGMINNNVDDIETLKTSFAYSMLANMRMTDGFASGITLPNGESIFWNQHITFDDSPTPAFARHSTSQIRVGNHGHGPIVGNIRTYVKQSGQRVTRESPPNMDTFIDLELLEWARDAHITYTEKFL